MAALDEASHIIGWDARSSWYSGGRPATAPVTLSRKRFRSLGAPVDGGLVCRLCDRANGDSFTGLLGHPLHRYGKIIAVLDNAAYHKSGKVMRFAGPCGGDIIPVCLPPYTPEPSPVGVRWRMVRKATANRLYATAKAMKDSIWAMTGSGELGVAGMSGYLS